MPSFQLSDIRTRTSDYKSIARPSLHLAITDSEPEPTTALGIVPGQAPFANYESAAEPISEPDNSTCRYSQRTHVRTPKASQHNQETTAQKAKFKAHRRRNSTATIASEGQTDINYVSDSTRGPPGDGIDEVLSGPAHTQAGDGGQGIPIVPRASLHSDVLPHASASGVSQVHDHLVSDPGVGTYEGGGESVGSARVSGVSGNHSGDGGRVAEGGENSSFWAFTVDHERLERDIQRLQNSDHDTVSQLPPEHLLALIRELAAEREELIGRQSHQARTERDSAQPSPPSPPASSQPAHHQPAHHQPAPSQPTPAQQTPSQEAPPHQSSQPTLLRWREAQPVVNTITVGGGHHLDKPRLSLNRPGPHHNNSHIDDTNTETESETELEELPPKLNFRRIQNPPHPSNSPSPLPSAHAPIDPSLHSTLEFPANPHAKSLGSTQQSTQPLITSAQRAPQPLFRQSSSTIASQPRSATSSISLGQPVYSHKSSRRDKPSRPPPLASNPGIASANIANIPRPQGTAGQESSRSHRTARKQAVSRQMALDRLPPSMRHSTEFARTRRDQREASSSTNAQPNLPAQPDLMEDDEEERAERAAYARGEEPRRVRKKKPSARDIHGNERQVLTHAKLHLYAYSIVEGPFQTRGVVQYWANPVWDLSWKEEFPELRIEPPSYESIQLMINCQPTYRGQVKDAMRSLTQHLFGFIKPATTPEAIEHNIQLCKELSPNGFHHISWDPLEGPYEGEAIYQAIAVALFRTPTSVGVAFPGYFKTFPFTGVAYSAANMQHTIEEFSTGHFVPRDLNATEMLGKFVAHLRGLKTASRKAKKRFAGHQLKWYQYGYDYSGAMRLDDLFTQPVITADNVRPDTPTGENDYLPETEGEDDDSEADENGRYSKRVKGKGRA